jgi:hypothetical protein
MRYVAAISAVAFAVLSGQALAQTQGYPVGGLGDAQAQDEPTSQGFNNGYNPPVGMYPAPRVEGRSAVTRTPRRDRD